MKRLFYLSWEDALWDILDKKKVKKQSAILVPSFYCGDVETNIKNHGYKIAHYRIEIDLSVNTSKFLEAIKRYNPSVIIIFHPVGLTCNLTKNTSWMNHINKHVITIEDSVHRIINPSVITIYRKNHFVINSLRKVVPLQGSSVYGLKDDLKFEVPPFYQSLLYSIKVNLFWLLMQIFWTIGLPKIGEKMMIYGYNIIGDSDLPASGFGLFKLFEEFINTDKISETKNIQANIYSELLGDITKIDIPQSDFGNLRGWPIHLPITNANNILKKIRDSGLILRFELNDSLWATECKIIYLPLGPYLKTKDIYWITAVVKNAWKTLSPSQ